MSAEDLDKTIAQLRDENAEVDAELRKRKDILEKSRKRYLAMLETIGIEHEDIMAIAKEVEFPAQAKSMLRKALGEQGENEGGEGDAQQAGEDEPPKKRKKRMIVKL